MNKESKAPIHSPFLRIIFYIEVALQVVKAQCFFLLDFPSSLLVTTEQQKINKKI